MKKLIIYHMPWCAPCRRYIREVLPGIEEACPGQTETREAGDYYSDCRRLGIQRVPAAVITDGETERLLDSMPGLEEAQALLHTEG